MERGEAAGNWSTRRRKSAALTEGWVAAASSNSDGGMRFRTGSGDEAPRHSGEAGDGFRWSGARCSDWCCRLRTAETATGRRFMAWARTAVSAQRGMWHARWRQHADEWASAERERLTGGTPRQIISELKTIPNENSSNEMARN
jgi:hypothetical protein